MTIAAIRAALIARFGARKYRITASGEIHAYGTLPNTSMDGWFVLGDVQTIQPEDLA
ncbi:hypothetical protein AVME950_02315 [Acidovorax sp. SUPP950]|uniref:hypothetical protein n=1 Tax=Acidovorax sp. SUPP950 TaxID=511901 RepID=UPI0023D325FC|nr:hypothetical protein [Acidovorax sp. SUPP950]GKS73681.1 hypothetical protein AVME950_02315 [Acidovorax sp. SUPP950]